ncbi:hypothetical protein TSMEX_006266 [Taenia solium]|eukprot:TsM_001101300 transcript=TsM_001101300 gene=TsM_001101300
MSLHASRVYGLGHHVKQIRLIGLGVALLGGFLLPALITLLHTKALAPEVALGVWSGVQEIDNPLVPWPELFTRDVHCGGLLMAKMAMTDFSFLFISCLHRAVNNGPTDRQTDLRFSPRLSEKKPALSEVRRALASLRHLTYGIAIFNLVIFLGFWWILGHAIQATEFDRFLFYTLVLHSPPSKSVSIVDVTTEEALNFPPLLQCRPRGEQLVKT